MSVASVLKERVTIQQLSLVDDGYGGQNQTWTTLATVFAQVEPIYVALNERQVAEQRNATAGYRVHIRVRTDVDAAMRLIWKTHTLLIHSLHEKGELLSILTYEESV